MSLEEISSDLLLVAFILYVVCSVIFAVSITGKKWSKRDEATHARRWGGIGFILTLIGWLFQVGYFITRWIASGHAPVSNMFEATTFFGMMLVFAFLIIYMIYKINVLGLFVLPVAMIIIAYASVFPTEIAPLIPALQSYWLWLHVMTTIIGEAIIAASFAAGLIYLLRVVDQSKRSKQTIGLEVIMFVLLATISFVLVSWGFRAVNYADTFNWVNEQGKQAQIVYEMPAIVGPYDGEQIAESNFGPLFEAPSWMNGKKAPSKLNTVIWSILGGIVLYILLRIVLRKRIAKAIKPVVNGVNPSFADEISYRAVAIGLPIFTLGGLVFAMIWAQEAWTEYWSWDPKEVWALVTFLFYIAYLHLRLQRGWHGERSAWLTVIGFLIITFNLIFVNLVIAGLHSYA